MTDWAALLAHWVLNTKIWLDCCMYCWSIADCCFDSTLEGRGWEGGMFMGRDMQEEVGGPGARPIAGPPRGGPPSPAKSGGEGVRCLSSGAGCVVCTGRSSPLPLPLLSVNCVCTSTGQRHSPALNCTALQ